MKRNELKSTKEKSIKELFKTLLAKKAELNKVSAKSEADKNVKRSRNLRREIAQISTIIRSQNILRSEGLEAKEVKKA